MKFICQQSALSELERLRDSDRHSVLIEGVSGCGKTYLAKQYSKMLNIPDFQIIEPNVNSIRESIEICMNLDHPIVLCIENLDRGVPAASYTILKNLEEPQSNIYIIITCRSSKGVPDTIVSRSVCLLTSPPVDSDIESYAMNKDSSKYSIFKQYPIWRSVRSFNDVDTLFNTTQDKLDYLVNYPKLIHSNDPVSTIQWNMGHYPDNSEVPMLLAIRYLMNVTDNMYIKKSCIECLNDMNKGRIAQHAALAKLIIECKYGGY